MFKIITWEEWTQDIDNRVRESIKTAMGDPNRYLDSIDIDDLIYAPKLDPENPKPFCERFVFDNLYLTQVFVEHKTEPQCYWFISGSDTCLIYKPTLA